MGFFSFLSYFRPWWKSTDTDYETVLIRLTSEIQSVQSRLVSVKTRERRASVTLTLYAFLVWLAYCGFCWWAHPLSSDQREMMLYVYLPCSVVPIMILSTRRVVRWWYRRIAAGEEKHLLSLQRARRSKIEEIKRATRYDSLRLLLEKYDDSTPAAKRGGAPATPAKRPAQQQPQQPAANGQKQPVIAGAPGAPVAAQRAQQAPGQGLANAVQPLPASMAVQPQSKTWLDKVADAVLGADPGTTGPEQRYALICKACFGHNGLCPKDEFEEIQYVCPKCGTFNSRRPSSVPVSSPWARQRVGSNASAASVPGSPTAGNAPRSGLTPSASSAGASGGRFLGVGEDEAGQGIARSASRGSTTGRSPLAEQAEFASRGASAGEKGEDEDEDDLPPAEPLRAGREGEEEEEGAEVKGYNLRERRKGATGGDNDGMEVD